MVCVGVPAHPFLLTPLMIVAEAESVCDCVGMCTCVCVCVCVWCVLGRTSLQDKSHSKNCGCGRFR